MYIVFLSFQCDADVPTGDELLHIISHHKLVKPTEIRTYLLVWVKKHKNFMEKISKDILTRKKLTLDDYISTVLTPGVPIDEIGLLILTRIYHLKLSVLLKNHYWCALNGSDVSQSEIIIVFCGKLQFTDTRSSSQNVNSKQYHLQHRQSLGVVKCPASQPTSEVPPAHTENPLPSTHPPKTLHQDHPKSNQSLVGQNLSPHFSLAHMVFPRVPKHQQYKCPAGCKVVTKSQRELNQHVCSKHPAFRFKCKLCGAEYLTCNARYKHE